MSAKSIKHFITFFLFFICSLKLQAAPDGEWLKGTFLKHEKSYFWNIDGVEYVARKMQKHLVGTVKYYICKVHENGSLIKLGVLKFKALKVEFTEYPFTIGALEKKYTFFDKAMQNELLELTALEKKREILTRKPIKWDEKMRCYTDTFYGRAAVASSRNLVLRNAAGVDSILLGANRNSIFSLDYVPQNVSLPLTMAAAIVVMKFRPEASGDNKH